MKPFAEVDVAGLAIWLNSIPVAEWPNLADPAWLGDRAEQITADLLTHFPGGAVSGVGLFLLASGQEHPAHRDEQPTGWVTRVHVPIVTNDQATVTTDAGVFHMEQGKAYRLDTRETHAVRNDGATPRMHLVFDVRQS